MEGLEGTASGPTGNTEHRVAIGLVGALAAIARDFGRGMDRAMRIAEEAPLAFDMPPFPITAAGVVIDKAEAYVRKQGVDRCTLLLGCIEGSYMKSFRAGSDTRFIYPLRMARYHVADLVKEGGMDEGNDAAAYRREERAREGGREAERMRRAEERKAEETKRERAAAVAALRPKSFKGGDRAATKAALLEAVRHYEGLTAKKLAVLVETDLPSNVVLGLLKELVEDGIVEMFEVKVAGKEGGVVDLRLHRLPDELSGLTCRELAAHPSNLVLHAHHYTTLAARIRRGMRAKEAIAAPKNQGGKGVKKRRGKKAEVAADELGS